MALLLAGAACTRKTEKAAPTGAAGPIAAQPAAAPPPPAPEGRPCASTTECPGGQHCTVEDGACDRPPGCRPGDICPEICYGVCAAKKAAPPGRGVACGPKTCPPGQICCNRSCGICTPPGDLCTQQVCEPGGGDDRPR